MTEPAYIQVSIPLTMFDEPGVRKRVEQYAISALRQELGADITLRVRWDFFPIKHEAVCEASTGDTCRA